MRPLRFFLTLLLLVPLAACALNGRPDAHLASEQPPYLLDTGDVVRLTVYGEADLTRSFRVEDSGALSLPLVGQVQVRGKTTQMASAAISAALAAGYIREPSVAVEIETYRPFYIQGAVKNSGQYPYVYGMTVRAAISTAGGYAEATERAAVVIHRRVGGRMVKGVAGQDFPVFPGDTIVVGSRFPQ
jgi:polysaccharide biosynthesis/export protein